MGKKPAQSAATRQKLMCAFWELYTQKGIEQISIRAQPLHFYSCLKINGTDLNFKNMNFSCFSISHILYI